MCFQGCSEYVRFLGANIVGIFEMSKCLIKINLKKLICFRKCLINKMLPSIKNIINILSFLCIFHLANFLYVDIQKTNDQKTFYRPNRFVFSHLPIR